MRKISVEFVKGQNRPNRFNIAIIIIFKLGYALNVLLFLQLITPKNANKFFWIKTKSNYFKLTFDF